MMRGTVYAIQEIPDGSCLIGRQVVQIALAPSPADFIQAVQDEQRPFPVGARLEFGPIGPPGGRDKHRRSNRHGTSIRQRRRDAQ